MRFLSARPQADPQAVIIGAPYDGSSTFRAGSTQAPAAIRHASESIETYSPLQRRDLRDLRIADDGDLDLIDCPISEVVERVRHTLEGYQAFPCLLGGEHTVSVGAIEALHIRHPDLAVVVLDAHLDLRELYEGDMWSHATTVARILDEIEPGRVAALGARAGTREEWQRAESLASSTRMATLATTVWATLAQRPLYLSVDIDAFDPSVAPGTGNPEPLGITVDDFVGLLSVLREGRVVGCDLVEVSPPCDPSGRTAVLAAWLVREMLLAFVR